jgi:ATP-binding cassette, subfamily G (WHITE), member 2, SNQ2
MADTPGDGATLYDGREDVEAQRSRENVDSDSSSVVDVARAERQFSELSRQLSRLSRKGAKKESYGDKAYAQDVEQDLEKAGEAGEVFDLREYLTSSNDANQEAGIKHKVCGFITFMIT